MQKMLVTILLSHLAGFSTAQKINLSAGYGSENNWGNNGVTVSAGYQKYFWRRVFIETDLRYFTTAVANVYHFKGNRDFPEEQRWYNVLFLAENLGYSIGAPDKFHINLKAGLSVFHQSFKVIDHVSYRQYADGHREVIGLPVYQQDRNIKLAYNASIDCNVPVIPGCYAGIGFDAYSNDLPGQFTQAYLCLKKDLK